MKWLIAGFILWITAKGEFPTYANLIHAKNPTQDDPASAASQTSATMTNTSPPATTSTK